MKVYYVSPNYDGETMAEYLTNEQFIEESCVSFNSVKAFEQAFNNGEISDLGYIRFIEE